MMYCDFWCSCQVVQNAVLLSSNCYSRANIVRNLTCMAAMDNSHSHRPRPSPVQSSLAHHPPASNWKSHLTAHSSQVRFSSMSASAMRGRPKLLIMVYPQRGQSAAMYPSNSPFGYRNSYRYECVSFHESSVFLLMD
jgi:hypothetical protein